MDNSVHSKEELNKDNSQIHPFKKLSKFLTKSTPINKKRMSQPIKRIKNLLESNSQVSSPKKSKNKKDKYLLILHKINIKDSKNNFYKKGATDIFNDENLFLSQYYKDKPVIVGKSKASLFYVKFYNNNNGSKVTKNINNFGKRRFYNTSMTSKSLYTKKENMQPQRNSSDSITNDLRKNKFVDKNIKIAYDFQNNKNNVAANAKSIIGKYEILKNMYNIYGKRAPIFLSSNSYITDGELKIIYQNFIDKVKDSKKKELLTKKLDDKKYIKKDRDKAANENNKSVKHKNKNNNNTLYKKIFKTTIDKEMYARLDLQEKILNKFQYNKKENQKLINKIKANTNKSSDDLLINQLDEYRNKLEKIEQIERKNQENNKNKTIYWLSSLRNYPQNSNKNENENSQNNINSSSLPILKKNNSSIYSIKYNSKDDIYDNYINNIHYSFGNNSNLYCDIESNIRPLCGLIIPGNYKENEKITNTHIDDNLIVNKNINNNSIYNVKQLIKNKSVPSLINKNTDKELKIEGKGLLDYEIGIYKELKGKRKKLIKMNYNDEDIDSKIFAKSYLLNNFYFPKAVKNTFDLH